MKKIKRKTKIIPKEICEIIISHNQIGLEENFPWHIQKNVEKFFGTDKFSKKIGFRNVEVIGANACVNPHHGSLFIKLTDKFAICNVQESFDAYLNDNHFFHKIEKWKEEAEKIEKEYEEKENRQEKLRDELEILLTKDNQLSPLIICVFPNDNWNEYFEPEYEGDEYHFVMDNLLDIVDSDPEYEYIQTSFILTNPTWYDVMKKSNELQSHAPDMDHVFLEGFKKEDGKFYIYFGS